MQIRPEKRIVLECLHSKQFARQGQNWRQLKAAATKQTNEVEYLSKQG